MAFFRFISFLCLFRSRGGVSDTQYIITDQIKMSSLNLIKFPNKTKTIDSKG